MKILKLIFCNLLKIHKFDDVMGPSLYSEGWDEYKECRYCGKTVGKYYSNKG